ncbi:uncharacterized protein LOC127377635 [Dicentrarchus labrax]|uniref:uncharacterized protein LOC127377635 n=1 Tax=Dicentrarchus labrax TaxID=13489 RepID=UPI0021F63A63|nr:uncharacterized protein LOC127377635 [Dicentrarchus labrax]
MKVHHTLICFFFLSLCGGDSGLVSATTFAGAVGGTGGISCFLSLSGSNKFFCKEQCKAEDILIKTDGLTAQSGRYSTAFRNTSSERGILTVTITNLTKSDSAWYRCGLGPTVVPYSYADFEIRVLDATLDGISGFVHADTEGETIVYGCHGTVYGKQKFLCKGDCKTEEDILIETEENRAQNGRHSIQYINGSVFGLYVIITQVTKSDTGWYKCGYGRALSPDSYRMYPVLVIDASTPTTTSTTTPTTTTKSTALSSVSHPGLLLALVVCMPLLCVLLAALLLLLYKWKTSRNFGLNTKGNADGMHVESSVNYVKYADDNTR